MFSQHFVVQMALNLSHIMYTTAWHCDQLLTIYVKFSQFYCIVWADLYIDTLVISDNLLIQNLIVLSILRTDYMKFWGKKCFD